MASQLGDEKEMWNKYDKQIGVMIMLNATNLWCAMQNEASFDS